MKEEYFNKTVGVVMASLLPQNEKRELIDSIRAMEKETKNNGWIPVSERLPEPKTRSFGNKQKRTNVLVTLRNGVVKEMTYEFVTKEFWEAGDENHIEHRKEDYNGNDIEVIAWQPLPLPYREEQEDGR